MLRFHQRFIDNLLATVPLADFIGRYVRLQKRGNAVIGLCPFHKEKTPSFHINEQKGVYHCFGCQASGNAISFMMSHQRLSFVDAVKALADLYQIAIPLESPEQQKLDSLHERLLHASNVASNWFKQNLFGDSADSAKARHYLLHERKFNETTIRHFNVGWAPPNKQAMIDALQQQGISLDDLFTLGLVKGEAQNIYSFFRSRIMVPITDTQNRTIAFGGRLLPNLSGSQSAKYINSTAHPLFDKSRVLFHLHETQKIARTAGPVVLVEGYMDVISLYQHGFKACVASLGTATTLHHLRALWQMSLEPVLCFDGDKAGRQATARLIETALPHCEPNKTLLIASLPEDTDPDNFMNSTEGRESFSQHLKNASTISAWLCQHFAERFPENHPESYAAMEQAFLDTIQIIKNPTLQKHYRAAVKDWLWQQRTRKNRPLSLNNSTTKRAITQQLKTSPLRERPYHMTLYILTRQPSLLKEFVDLLEIIKPSHPDLKKLQEQLLEYVWTEQAETPLDLRNYLARHHLGTALDYLYTLHLDRLIIEQGETNMRSILEEIRGHLSQFLSKEEQRRKMAAAVTTAPVQPSA